MNALRTAELSTLVGGLSAPSKMPGFGYSIPAQNCRVGSLLRNVKGSVCFSCYAFKGRYSFPNVQNAMKRRLETISRPYWTEAMTELISRKAKKVPYFRWHDSGDVQDLEHLSKIVEIAKNLPSIFFWLPTREYAIVKKFLAENPSGFPANLTVRISAPMIGQELPKIPGTVNSSVDGEGISCPAPEQGNSCGSCRACWNPNVERISYHKH